MTLRIRFEYDQDPDTSYFEQWDTPEKYYGKAPDCPKCKCEMTYEKDHRWLCDECGRDDDVTYLEWAGDDGGESGVMLDDGRRVPFDEYSENYGDPENHVFLCAVVEEKCDHCGSWVAKDSLCGIDFMESDDWCTGTFPEDDLSGLSGYMVDLAKELLDESKTDAATA